MRVETLAQVAALLASADPNVAQIPQSQFVYLELARQVGTEAQQELLFGEVLDGRRIANAQSEAGSKTVADIRTTPAPAPGRATSCWRGRSSIARARCSPTG